MGEKKPHALRGLGAAQAAAALRASNGLAGRYGLCLSEQDIQMLVVARDAALGDTGRVNFGQDTLQRLAEAFCDSAYVDQGSYAGVLAELIESFYYFKNESMDLIPDDELMEMMRHHYDTVCQGSLEYLCGTTLEELCRNTRYGHPARARHD